MTIVPARIERDELAFRLGLLATPGLPQRRVRSLLAACGSGREAHRALADVCGAEVAAAARSDTVRQRVSRALSAIRRDRIAVLTSDDPLYPCAFRDRDALGAPPLLFARGRLELLSARSVAVVGCRKATEYGLDIAEEIGGAVGRAGGCVVSGLALGIDAAAHQAALDAGGDTVAVLGCGVDVYYPRHNIALQDRIAHDGLLLSELLPGEPPRKHQFPERNRLIAGLVNVVVVVEAGEKSGALTTGRHGIEQGIDVYGVPNAMHLPNMQGILELMREGIYTYTGPADLLAAAGLIGLGDPKPADTAPLEAPTGRLHRRIWEALQTEPMHVDRIAAAVSLPVHEVLGVLLELELDAMVVHTAGQRYTRRGRRSRAA